MGAVATVLLWLSPAGAQEASALPAAPQPATTTVADALRNTQPLRLSAGVTTPAPTGAPLDLSLSDAVSLALERNLQVVADRQQEFAADALRLEAIYNLIPNLTANFQSSAKQINLRAQGLNPQSLASALPPGAPPISPIVKVNVTQAKLNLTQTLFNLPAIEALRGAPDQIASYHDATESDRDDVVQRVATQYLRCLSDQSNIRNLESQVQQDLELERDTQARLEAGVDPKLELLRAQVQRQSSEQQVISARNTFEKDKIQLNRLMGLSAGQALNLVTSMPTGQTSVVDRAEANRTALQQRHDLQRLDELMRSDERQVLAVRYERLPGAKVNGFYGVAGETTGLYHGVFSATGTLDFPIFEAARFRGDAELAGAQLRQVRAQRASLMADIDEQIRAALLDLESDQQLVDAARSNVELAQAALSDARERYRAGVDTNLPVVRAIATLTGAQTQLVQAVFQLNQARLQLARSMGTIQSSYVRALGL